MITLSNTSGVCRAKTSLAWLLPCFAAVIGFTFISLSHAQTLPATNQQLYLTIYNNNLALVEDKRTLNLPQGRSTLEFKNISASIRPETVSLNALGVNIIEQNFDFDLLTPNKLMEKSVGQQVQLVRTNPGNGQQTTEVATVLSVNEGVVLSVNGRIEVLRADAIPTRVIFNKIPDNLRASPLLSISVAADKAGARNATLSYLTTGLSWKADYVALFDEKAQQLDLQGWVTLTNNSGTTFHNVNAQLVAGDINLTNNWGDYEAREKRRIQARRSVSRDSIRKPALADYYLYPLTERTTIADKQTKQVSFLEASGVKAKKIYAYKSSSFSANDRAEHASVLVDFNNTASTGLGAELPEGIMRVYMRDHEGKPKFIGESAIEHTPQGSHLSVRTGEAFDITVEPAVTKEESLSKTKKRFSVEYAIHNSRNEDAVVELEQSSYFAIRKIVSESIKSQRIDAYTLKWLVPVKAKDETVLSFVVENEN